VVAGEVAKPRLNANRKRKFPVPTFTWGCCEFSFC